MILFLAEKIAKPIRSRKDKRKILKQIDSLNPREAHLLVVTVARKLQRLNLRPDGDEIFSLISEGMLEKVPNDSKLPNKPFTVPRFVWEHIQKKPVFDSLQKRDEGWQ